MATPLSPTKQSTLNIKSIDRTTPTTTTTPPTPTEARRRWEGQYEIHAYTEQQSSSATTNTSLSSTANTTTTTAAATTSRSNDTSINANTSIPNTTVSNISNISPSPSNNNHNSSFSSSANTPGVARGRDTTNPSDHLSSLHPPPQLMHNKENMSPPKQRHSRIMSGNELSPLKMLSTADSLATDRAGAIAALNSPARASRKSLLSPDKRFPIRVSNPTSDTADSPSPPPETRERTMSMDDALRDNPGLSKAIQIFEDDEHMTHEDDEQEREQEREREREQVARHNSIGSARSPLSTSMNMNNDDDDDNAHSDDTEIHHHDVSYDDTNGPDETMMSTFSTFSAVPNMTMLAKFGNTPSRHGMSPLAGMTPRARPDPSPSRGGRPMSIQHDSSGNTTNLLMDFTDQLRFPGRAQGKPGSASSSNSGGVAATPSRQQTQNLLDFDIPPMPTPRSLPSITPRELESLKSGFLSEISSLKATLSGKEAEVLSLKTAVGDAEKRVGESMERAREAESEREHLAVEKDGWEKRSREMEAVLRSVKEEIVLSQREREELEYKLSESEQRREAAETMAQEAESKLAGMRAGRATEESARVKSPGGGASNSTKDVEMAVERVARELHALYKSKHETKVAALKKSYEGRWEKRVRELENKIEDLGEENERMRLGRDATMTRVDPQAQAAEEERKAQAIRDSAHLKELGAEVEKLEAVLRTIQGDNSELRILLERERVEKGELVQLAEEMMNMQSFVAQEKQQAQQQQQQQQQQQPATVRKAHPTTAPSYQSEQPTPARTPGKLRTPGPVRSQTMGNENLRGSVSRISGLKAPGSSIVMPGRGAAASNHERTRSNAGPGLPRPGSGFGARSGIMSSIEKMGSHRGRGE